MRTYKEVVIPEHTKTMCTAMFCDICGEILTKEMYSADDCEVSCKEGSDYGSEGGDYTETEFDLCLKCFKTVLAPFIESHKGSKPTVEERSW